MIMSGCCDITTQVKSLWNTFVFYLTLGCLPRNYGADGDHGDYSSVLFHKKTVFITKLQADRTHSPVSHFSVYSADCGNVVSGSLESLRDLVVSCYISNFRIFLLENALKQCTSRQHTSKRKSILF